MADFALRNRLAIRSVALVLGLALSLLTGCATIPKTAPTQFANFSNVTDKLSDDTAKIYDYAYSLEETYFKEKFIQGVGVKEDALHYPLTYTSPKNLAFKKLLLDTLKAYALHLKYIMSDEIDAGFDTSVTDLTNKLLNLQATAVPALSLPEGIDSSKIAQGAVAIASFLRDRQKKKEVTQALQNAQSGILYFIDVLQKEIGTCGASDNPLAYCVGLRYEGATVTLLNRNICTYFKNLIALQQSDAADAQKKLSKEGGQTAQGQTPSAQENQKAQDATAKRKAMISYRIKRDKACSMLAVMQTALESYKAVIESLPETLDKPHSDRFAKALAATSTQLGIVDQLLQQSSL